MNGTQNQNSKRKWSSWIFWIVLSGVILITLGIIGIIVWLLETQDLDKLYTKLGVIASIVTTLIGPLVLFFTISKWPDRKSSEQHVSPLMQVGTAQAIPTQSLIEMTQSVKIWNVPYRRNPFFTGRENLLEQLHENLNVKKTAALALTQPQAISGLGGIGKTQIAVEYAYSYRDEYGVVLWARATTRETLVTDFVTIAALLHLPEQDVTDQRVIFAAVKEWLTEHTDWLLILDNADDIKLVSDFLPTGGNGRILITTRVHATGSVADAVEVGKLNVEEGTLLLLRRAKLLAPDAPLSIAPRLDRIKARAIVKAVDGLPLALDQAGAYIEETCCSLSTYLDRYQQRQADLLKRRGQSSTEHPESVATTWSLSFEQIERDNPAAADLLRFCAFVAPDVIQEEMIVEAASELGPFLQAIVSNPSLLDEAIGALRRFSLVRRNSKDGTLSIHSLVQATLKDRMMDEMQLQWAKRTVRAVNLVFPKVTYETWTLSQRYLPHAEACALLIMQYRLMFPEAARLLIEAGRYLRERAQFTQSEPLLLLSLAIYEQVLGPERPEVAYTLNGLALLYHSQGRFSEAEPLYRRAHAIRERVLGPEHPETAFGLNNWAELYREQGRYSEAEPLYQRSLAIREKVLGAESSSTAIVLNNLARLYYAQGQYVKAEPLYQRALTIWDQTLMPEHPNNATILDNLARLYFSQGQYVKAEPLMRRAVAIHEKANGPKHPYFARSLSGLAEIYCAQGHFAEAEPLMRRALAICEKVLGPKHHYSIFILANLAELYRVQGRYSEAEPFYQRVLTTYENLNLSLLIASKADEPLYQHALAIYDKVPGPDDPDIATVFENYATLLRETNRIREASMFEARAKEIRAKLLSLPN